ncbi:sugar-binding protein [Fictibacillus terranigra]|uniref:Sugar-binding protein n=1 Tax=Fictibacillus terranigra TaxID=3058424 RepID=A0ABT8E7K6_9BACL|nr:sugar-binding protein [Fictibacillus sp. CENA-BCM004]MDN4073878.1 sugar-binding protein [Fictibacillus sp. CENA-BCM004]
MRTKSKVLSVVSSVLLVCGLLPATTSHAAKKENPLDLDMLFIGAHPDDEAGGLSTYGQWIEDYGYKMGVMTITRGEGGGNAVGPEEGSSLGLLREKEERKAVDLAGIENVFNLDKVDFYYNVSAPLTEKVWEHDSTLEKVVRTIRMTKPEVLFTMNPSPTPGNHGHHQYAARMAVEAFYAAADPKMFPEQLNIEGLKPWEAKKIVYRGASGKGMNGEKCESSFVPDESTDKVYGVWSGRESEKYDKSWAQVEREAQRMYKSQGWATFQDAPSDPNELSCDYFTEFDSRVPTTSGKPQSNDLLEGALFKKANGLPLGVQLSMSSTYEVTSDQSIKVKATIKNNSNSLIKNASLNLGVPDGWKATKAQQVKLIKIGETKPFTFEVNVPHNPDLKRYEIKLDLKAGKKEGAVRKVLKAVPIVEGNLKPLPHVQQFKDWTKEHQVQQLENLITPVFSMGTGETKEIGINVTNHSKTEKTGEVALTLPAGFKAEESVMPYTFKSGETRTVHFKITNNNPMLPTSNDGGDYPFTVQTKTDGVVTSTKAAINLVPVTKINQAKQAPKIDGTEEAGEYPDGDIDLSRIWEGQPLDSSKDASGNAKLSWDSEGLNVLVNVQDDVLGTVLPKEDAKRHWRTDSVEIAIDPKGNSENTSSTFKVGVFPITKEGGPAAYRDADNFQGPVSETAPGMKVASKIDPSHYNGYTLEVKVPYTALPAPIDPEHMSTNVFIYDSDTQDKTGQTRLGWSTWGGVQGDPYRWGHGIMEGFTPDKSIPDRTQEPQIPQDVAKSLLSPQSILQSAHNHVPLASGIPAPKDSLKIVGKPLKKDGKVTFKGKASVKGCANFFVWDPVKQKVVEQKTGLRFANNETKAITFNLSEPTKRYVLLASYETKDYRVLSLAQPFLK